MTLYPDQINLDALVSDAIAKFMEGVNLIPVQQGEINGEPQLICNARELHTVLGVGKDFSTWLKDRISEYGFIEGEDFSPNLGKTSKGTKGGRPTIDYHLTLDMAKEIAMVENNDVGRRVRRHFIACEKMIDRLLKNHNEAMRTEMARLALKGPAALCLAAEESKNMLAAEKLRHRTDTRITNLEAKLELKDAEITRLSKRVTALEEGGKETEKQWAKISKGGYGFMTFDWLHSEKKNFFS